MGNGRLETVTRKNFSCVLGRWKWKQRKQSKCCNYANELPHVTRLVTAPTSSGIHTFCWQWWKGGTKGCRGKILSSAKFHLNSEKQDIFIQIYFSAITLLRLRHRQTPYPTFKFIPFIILLEKKTTTDHNDEFVYEFESNINASIVRYVQNLNEKNRKFLKFLFFD